MIKNTSITQRLILSVLLLEVFAAIALIAAITVEEHSVQLKAFDANERGIANALLGAVQEADTGKNDVMLDLSTARLPPHSIYRVTDEQGKVLGASGILPPIPLEEETFQHIRIDRRSYRFFIHAGERVIDPGTTESVHHRITVIYGLPDRQVWHEVFEAVRFFAIATALLLGITALLLVWLVRRWLQPIRLLAIEADKINAFDWKFHPPESARQFDELRPLATAIEKTLERLQRSFEQQKRFTSDAAHELKTDLAIVKSGLQLLTMKKRSTDEYERGLAISLEDFTRMEGAVQKMLTLARLEQPQEEGPHSCLLDEALAEAVHQSQPYAALRQISIMVHAAKEVSVPLDSRDAAMLCGNVLLNALQHSPDGGVVEVVLGLNDSKVSLTVRDKGEGIGDSDPSLLFEPFYRGDPSRSRKSGGTGLGLSICKAICDRVNGSIAIANHPQGGAIVVVWLPSLSR